VLFEAPLAAGLLGSLVHAASGGALYRKSSFLLDHLGKQVMPDFVNISEQPHILRGLGSASFDSDGVATKPRSKWSANGILQGYFLSTYTARKLGMQTTANAGGSHNLIIQPGELDFAGLLARMGTGLLVTELLGQGINYVTGDYSRGAAGYLGREWTDRLSGRRDYYRRQPQGDAAGIVAVGNDVQVRGSKQTGSILVDRMTVAGE
jgi:PmbA protein